jgi:hypothetical protein
MALRGRVLSDLYHFWVWSLERMDTGAEGLLLPAIYPDYRLASACPSTWQDFVTSSSAVGTRCFGEWGRINCSPSFSFCCPLLSFLKNPTRPIYPCSFSDMLPSICTLMKMMDSGTRMWNALGHDTHVREDNFVTWYVGGECVPLSY